MNSVSPADASIPDTQSSEFIYCDRIVRLFCLAMISWGVVAVLGFVLGTLLMLNPQISLGAPELAYGRLGSLPLQVAVFGFACNAVFAGVYYATQRLCQRPLWSAGLGYLHFLGWQATLITAGVWYAKGFVQYRELAEMAWPLDLTLLFVWLLFGANILMTVFLRRARHMYVSLWFFIVSILAFPIFFSINNLVLATEGYSSIGFFGGVEDAFVQSWYLNGILIYLLIMPGLGMMYYFVPKVASQPIYNYRLAIVQFWILTLLGGLAGGRFLHLTAIPESLSTVGMLAGFLLWMPLWAGVINGWGTLSEGRRQGGESPASWFFTVGLLLFAFASLEGTWSAIKTISGTTLFTDWTVAHIYALIFGWVGFLGIGMLYFVMPKIFQADTWSPTLVRAHYWLSTAGVLLMLGCLYGAGFIQSSMTHGMDRTGTLLYMEYIDITVASKTLWIGSAVGGGIFLLGFLFLLFNFLMTWSKRPRPYQRNDFDSKPLHREYQDDPAPMSGLEGAPVLGLGCKIDVWTRLQWHRRWERKAIKFTAMTMCLLVGVTLLQMIPLLQASDQRRDNLRQRYTPLELAGRQIFVREGCVQCHSQVVRPLVSETKRYGDYSQAKDYVFDRPSQWGRRRVGPDLAQEGGRHDSYWHWRHLRDPRGETPGSIMPSYQHLVYEDLDLDAVRAAILEAQQSGLNYSAELEDLETVVQRDAEIVAADIVKAGGPAVLFDKQATALIAYLQRLGKEPESPAAAASGAN